MKGHKLAMAANWLPKWTKRYINVCIITEPLKLHGAGRNWCARKKYFSNVSHSLAKLLFPQETLHPLANILHSLAKIFEFHGNFCVLFQIYLRSLVKQKQSWVQTNSSRLLQSLQWFIQLRMFRVEQFIEFYFELGLMYKEIHTVLRSRHGFGTL